MFGTVRHAAARIIIAGICFLYRQTAAARMRAAALQRASECRRRHDKGLRMRSKVMRDAAQDARSMKR